METDSSNDALITSSRDDAIEGYKETKSTFSDYTRFEDPNNLSRAESRQRFIDGVDYVPMYDYPKLSFFKDDEATVTKKTSVQNALMELEVARKAAELMGDVSRAAELQLYCRFHEVRLQKIMLVDAARRLHESESSSATEVARKSFMDLNKEIYGEMNTEWYTAMLGDEQAKLAQFVPKDETSQKITEQLKVAFDEMGRFEPSKGELLSSEEMGRLHDVIWSRYRETLAAIPDTESDTYYDATECAEIINNTLYVSGLADKGWSCEIDAAKSNPATNGATKKIILPSSTRRNASELRRLVMHEQEVHARRAQNAKDLNVKVLKSGTADYADVEEGLGVLFECGVEGNLSNPSFDRARERYMAAGLALGLEGKTSRDARGVYEIMWRIVAMNASEDGTMSDELVETAKKKAFTYIENAFRGTDFSMRGIIYTKLKVYYEGLVKNTEYIHENRDNLEAALDRAMMGKMDHTNPEEVRLIEEILEAN